MIDSRLFCLVLTHLHKQVWSVVYLSQSPAVGAAKLTFCARYMGCKTMESCRSDPICTQNTVKISTVLCIFGQYCRKKHQPDFDSYFSLFFRHIFRQIWPFSAQPVVVASLQYWRLWHDIIFDSI